MRTCAILFLIFVSIDYAMSETSHVYGKVGDNITLDLGKNSQYRRLIGNVKHIFRVCNGKNTANCGYWENISRKKKVANAAMTSYNSTNNVLTLKNVTKRDDGLYWGIVATNYTFLHLTK